MEKDLKQTQFYPEPEMEMDQVLYPDLSYGDIGNQGGYGPCTEPYKKKEGANQVYDKTEAAVERLTEASVGMASEGDNKSSDNKSTGNQNVKDCNENMKNESAQVNEEVKKQ